MGFVLLEAICALIFIASVLSSPTDNRDFASPDGSVYASIKLFAAENLKGFNARIPISKPNVCLNIACFNDKTASASWELPRKAMLVFFSNAGCQGDYEWFNFRTKVTNTKTLKSDVKGAVSSVLVFENGAGPIRYIKECPNGTEVLTTFQPKVPINEPAQ